MTTERADTPLRLHLARWVVPVGSSPIENGAVATFGGRIVAVGHARELQAHLLGERKDHGDVILCPALVNVHSHLELSALKWRLSPGGDFVGWIRSLIAARERIEPGEWEPAIHEAVADLKVSGVIAVGDVGNTDFIPRLSQESGNAWPLRGVFFRELIAPSPPLLDVLGASKPSTRDSGSRDTNPKLAEAFSAHAPYSVTPSVLEAIKAWARRRGLPFSIHVAESLEEVEFLRDGVGPIKDFLNEKGHWPLGFPLPGCSPIAYLDRFALLDETTICVHSVHVDEADVAILVRSGAAVCLCPRSNVFLGVGIPPAEQIWRAGVSLALGTDSLASNDRLSIFAEMSSLANLAPGLEPAAIVAIASLGGARALGIEADWGTLSPGRIATFLAVRPAPSRARDVLECLVHQVAKYEADCYWIEEGE